jgi:hypothetical protein
MLRALADARSALTGHGVTHQAEYDIHLDCQHVITFVYASTPSVGETLWCTKCQSYHPVTGVDRRCGGSAAVGPR